MPLALLQLLVVLNVLSASLRLANDIFRRSYFQFDGKHEDRPTCSAIKFTITDSPLFTTEKWQSFRKSASHLMLLEEVAMGEAAPLFI
jgi:hypothetical protein